ncbi:Uncharacterised protein [Streptococcus pneumoniae]|nr:Uncharacterised protein [Streptococcus pneumoniae]
MDIITIIEVMVLKQKVLVLNTFKLSNGLDIVNCRLININIIIRLMINVPMIIGLPKPKLPALLNAYNIIPNPIVEYNIERLSSLVCLVSL